MRRGIRIHPAGPGRYCITDGAGRQYLVSRAEGALRLRCLLGQRRRPREAA